MRRAYYLLLILFSLAILIPAQVGAQGMMNFSSAQENKNLTDEDYEDLGERWMELALGENHQAADEHMREMMGEDFLRQMHIAMGKQIENPQSFGMMPMMGMMGFSGQSMMGARTPGTTWPLAGSFRLGGIHSLLMIVTWLSFIAFLLAGARWFWMRAKK